MHIELALISLLELPTQAMVELVLEADEEAPRPPRYLSSQLQCRRQHLGVGQDGHR